MEYFFIYRALLQFLADDLSLPFLEARDQKFLSATLDSVACSLRVFGPSIHCITKSDFLGNSKGLSCLG